MYTKKFLYDEICDWFIALYKRSDDKKQVFNDKTVLRLYDLINKEEKVVYSIVKYEQPLILEREVA